MTKDLNDFIRRRGRRRYVPAESKSDAPEPKPISSALGPDDESLSSRIRRIATENDPNLLRRERRKLAANNNVTDAKGQV